jgi:hypothetical protein
MEQVQRQPGGQERRQRSGFQPGVSGNPRGGASRQERIKAKEIEVAMEFGGLDRLTTFQRGLVRAAAELLCRQPIGHVGAVRHGNTLTRLYEALRGDQATRVRRIGG